MNGSRTIPNLFIVGAPKCGTTAMHTYLGQHPEIFMARVKENNHFATDLIPPADEFRSDGRYFEMFREAGDKKIVGESSVYYMLSKIAAENIRRFNPEAKIIIMLRNPVDVLHSFHAQLIYNGDEDIMDFEAALEAETKRKSGELQIKKGLRFNERLFYSEVVSCAEQVQRYLYLFPKEQVYIIIYDDFRIDTAGVYRKTLEFLNVDPMFQPDFPIVNPRKMLIPHRVIGKKGWRGFLLRMIELPVPPVRFMIQTTPQTLRNYLKRVLFDMKPSGHPNQQNPPMCSETRRQLQKTYRLEIEKVEKLLGRDLCSWYQDCA